MANNESPHTIEFLQEAARLLPTHNRTQLLLKSYYLSRASSYQASPVYRQPHDDGLACRKCCLPWKDQRFQMQVRPSRTRKRRARKIVERSEAKQTALSRSHGILAKKYLKIVNPVVRVTCPVCKTPKKTVLRQPIERPKSVSFTPNAVSGCDLQLHALTTDLQDVELSAKKKRRKSDKHAGLIIPASVLNKQVQRPTAMNVMPIVESTHVPPSPKPMPPNPVKPNNVLISKPKPTAGHKQLQHHPKKPAKSKKQAPHQITASSQRSAAEKQRNNILLLANALKVGATNVASPLRGLQSMLRK